MILILIARMRSSQALVKKFTKHNLKDATGPVTVVSGKKRRLTFLECPNDLSSMIVRVARLMHCAVGVLVELWPAMGLWSADCQSPRLPNMKQLMPSFSPVSICNFYAIKA